MEGKRIIFFGSSESGTKKFYVVLVQKRPLNSHAYKWDNILPDQFLLPDFRAAYGDLSICLFSF